ncbi:MAG: Smr/MutS family protein, partial [Acidobacteria bacterium]|nr:Smr/MutS family protein [Acidobacteriota bacterium]
ILSAGKLEVEAGPMKLQVSLEDVLEVLPSAPPLPKGVTLQSAPRPEGSLTEINVIGSTAEEARDRVDKFLDSAVISLIPRVRIVHGHGMGVLRRTLWEMLASHPHVSKFYHPDQREGGTGATIVELKS